MDEQSKKRELQKVPLPAAQAEVPEVLRRGRDFLRSYPRQRRLTDYQQQLLHELEAALAVQSSGKGPRPSGGLVP